VDTTALPSLVDVSFLGDRGLDVARFGAGNDFFNGAQDADKGWGGSGRDWLRTGLADDYIDGEAGGDHLVGVANADTVIGGEGDDRLGGDDGNDKIFAGTGTDFVICGSGTDDATVDSSDRASNCEKLFRS
jgi:Ca2+-binding RTX toxin-like protein